MGVGVLQIPFGQLRLIRELGGGFLQPDPLDETAQRLVDQGPENPVEGESPSPVYVYPMSTRYSTEE
jgi:hypothetical protein